jgi:predicted helicase
VIDGDVPGRNSDKSLFDDILDVAKAHTIFSHHASLYNLYVYFWRWAIWKAFEAHGDGPAVISFITGNSWLRGPGFVGLRQLVRQICDEVWVIDLGGDNKGANPEENVFAIETPVAVVTLVRNGASDREKPAVIHYRRVFGTAGDKLRAMQSIAKADDPLSGDWSYGPTGWLEPFAPPTGDEEWTSMPLLTALFPWQQPGCKFGRTWPIAPSEQLLEQRWARFTAAPTAEKPKLFSTNPSGRSVETQVKGLGRLVETNPGDQHRPIRRYGYRSFDRQSAFDDPRLAKTESPSLWQSRSDEQLFLASTFTKPISKGPALTASAHVPDLDYFNGRGGKDIVPLWRDAAATQPNITRGLAVLLGKRLGIAPPSVEDLAAYTYALLSASRYQERFADALRTAGLRVPVTADRRLWVEAVEAGRELLWLHTYAERFSDTQKGRGRHVPLVEGIEWEEPVRKVPQAMSAIRYDEPNGILIIGDGRIGGVRPDVWHYEVSGMPVLRKWLGYRTAKGTGRATSSKSALDHIRPSAWADEWNDELLDLIRVLTLTLDRQEALADLLDRVCDGPLIPAGEFPRPGEVERQPPTTSR